MADKDAITALIDGAEFLYFENAALKLILDRRVPNWRNRLAELMENRAIRQTIRDQFQPVRDSFAEQVSQEHLLEAVLRVFPATKDVN